ncbi:MAG: ComEC/Rec2 family competence protein [Lachnospiraceae bacterium]
MEMKRLICISLAMSMMLFQVGCSDAKLAKEILNVVVEEADIDIDLDQIEGVVDAVTSALEESAATDTIAEVESEVLVESSTVISEDGEFMVHFIDVGQADAALIMCDGEYMLIDGGNVDDSSLIVAVIESYGIEHLDYVVNTHPHEDHVGGLTAALSVVTADVVYSSMLSYDSNAFRNFVEATEAQGLEVLIPEAGDFFMLGSSEVTVLGPLEEYSDTNDTSIVMKIVYGDTSFMFTGDMETTAEKDLLEVWGEEALESTFLKVGHHGSSSSTCYEFLRAVYPSYALISCGEDNSYGHPHEETTSKLDDAGVMTYRTDLEGDVIVMSDGTALTIVTEQY